jgi:hypothetical protein
MFDKIKSRFPRKNPFANDLVGEAIYERLLLVPVDEREAEYESLSDDAKASYNAYLTARDNRTIAKSVLGITFVGGALTGLVMFLSSDEDEEDEDDEDADDENVETEESE